MVFKTTSSSNLSRHKAPGGHTLIEYIVGVGIAGVVLTVVMALVLYSGRNFASLANYANMQATSLNAIDQMSKDIRQTGGLIAYSTNSRRRRRTSSGNSTTKRR